MAFPLKEYVVFGIIECSLDDGRMVVLGDDDRLVALWFRPVVGIVGVFSCRIGEPEGNGCPPV